MILLQLVLSSVLWSAQHTVALPAALQPAVIRAVQDTPCSTGCAMTWAETNYSNPPACYSHTDFIIDMTDGQCMKNPPCVNSNCAYNIAITVYGFAGGGCSFTIKMNGNTAASCTNCTSLSAVNPVDPSSLLCSNASPVMDTWTVTANTALVWKLDVICNPCP